MSEKEICSSAEAVEVRDEKVKKVLTGTDGSSIISYVATHKRCEARIDAWLSLVERCVRDAEVAGSNPVASIFLCPEIADK